MFDLGDRESCSTLGRLVRVWLTNGCLVLAVLAAVPCQASALGYTLSPTWHRLDPAAVPRDAASLAADPRFAGADPGAFLRAVARVESGDYEFFFRPPVRGFAENVAISRERSSLTADASEIDRRCKSLPEMVARRYGRPVKPARCEVRQLNGRLLNTIEVEGPIEGTWNLQAQIEESPERSASVLMTVWADHLDWARGELEEILQTVDFTGSESTKAPVPAKESR